MITGGDGASDTLAATHTPVLLESLGSLDARRVGSRADIDVVDAAVGRHLALLCRAGRWIVGAEGFDDVVFHEGVASPAVEGEVGVSVGGVVSRVCYGSVQGEVVRDGLIPNYHER